MAKTQRANKDFAGAPEETPITEQQVTETEEATQDSSFSLESRQVTPEVPTVGTTYEFVVGGSVHIRQDH